MADGPKRVIAIVTGANSGVGYGISLRLLFQLSSPTPSDAPLTPFAGAPLTLILACRSPQRAHAARERLLAELDRELARRRRKGEGVVDGFKQDLVLEFVKLDLGGTRECLDFVEEVRSRYPYVTHLFCNAGLGTFTGINWPAAIGQILTHPIAAATAPNFKLQSSGETTAEGVGWVWQANVFGHYILASEFLPHLRRSPFRAARILWTSSLEAYPSSYAFPSDWQAIRTPKSYEASKYATELLGAALDEKLRGKGEGEGKVKGEAELRSFVVHPGIVASSIMSDSILPGLGWVVDYCMLALFYLVRLLGSPNHPITPLKGAVSATHVALSPSPSSTAPLSCTPPPSPDSPSPAPAPHARAEAGPHKYGSCADQRGREYVLATPLAGGGGEEEWEKGRRLLGMCEELRRELCGREKGE